MIKVAGQPTRDKVFALAPRACQSANARGNLPFMQTIPHRPQSDRPVFLDLWRIRLPLPALVSILHRIAGVMLLLALPLCAVLLDWALRDAQGFAAVATLLGHPLFQPFALLLLWALLHHLFAGARLLLLDLGWGLARGEARRSARLTLLAALALTPPLWAWFWLASR